MTWVVGLQSLGWAAMLGDVRASYGDVEAPEFGIHKVHKLGNRMAVGFAGSAKIGFSEVARLQDWASVIGGVAEVPELLAAWYADAYEQYESRYASEDREDGCDLIFIGSAARKVLTADGREIGPADPTLGSWHRTHGYEVRFPSPGDPGAAPSLIGNFGAAIGAGAEVNAYVESIRENVLPAMLKLRDIGSARQSAEVMHVVISAALNAIAERVPTHGVVPMFTGAVFCGDGVFFDSSHHGALGSGPLPPIAGTYRELAQLERDYGVPVAGAKAVAGRKRDAAVDAWSVDQQYELSAHAPGLTDAVRFRDVGQGERLPDRE